MRVNARVLWAVVWASSAGSSWVSSAPPPELIDWVAIPGGTFQMGSDDHLEDEMPRHRVEIRPFEMSKTEVTVAQYRACVEAGKCREPRRGGTCNWGKAGMENTALVCVDWDLAQEFAAWAGARLPTEAEWEYAATSAGKERVYPWGDEVPGCGRAIILGCKDGLPEVCSRPSGNTEQGLCDMAASVWEWVEDWYRSGYKDAPADGGPWRVPNGSFFHVMRGGSWMYDASWARAQKRNDFMPGGKAADLGIRLVRSKHSYAKTIEKKTPEATSIGGGGKDFAALAYSPDEKSVLSGAMNGDLEWWDIATGNRLASWKAHRKGVHSVVFLPGGGWAVSAGGDVTKVWNLKTRTAAFELRHEGRIEKMTLAPDGNTLIVLYYDNELTLWDLKLGHRTIVMDKGTLIPADSDSEHGSHDVDPSVRNDFAVAAAVSPDGASMLVGRWDNALMRYDLKTLGGGNLWAGHERRVTAIAFSPDGRLALSGDRGGTVILWDAAAGVEKKRWESESENVLAVAFSPDGRSAHAVNDGLVYRRWDTASGEPTASWKGRQRSVEAAVFSADGRRLLSVGEEKIIKLWDLSGDVSVLGAKEAAWSGDEKARLGRMLFFDSRMSGDDSFSCALCHKPEKAFTDGKALSMGFTETLYFRNTPTLLNAADQKQLYWDGRFADGDMLSLMRDHLSEAHFMNVDGRLVEQRLRQAPDYVKAFRSAYGGEPTYGKVLDALSAFVSSLKSGESAYDRYKNGEKDALSKAAERGRILFEGKGGCAACHAGPDFSDGKLHNRKVPENPEIFTTPLRHISFRRFFRLLGVRGYADLREDLGYWAISGFAQDRGKFRTPSLRNVARTAPYMHNGMIKTLEEAVKHEGPKLSRRNRADLVEFLKALSAPVPEIVEPDLPRFEKFIRIKSSSALRAPGPPPEEKKGTAQVAPLAALPAVPIPPDNLQSPEKIELGKLLYFDPRTSGNGHTSCVACHVPEVGWGDALDLSREYTSTMHFRHTQTVLNAAYLSKLNWDGFASSLEAQAEDAITTAIVGNGDPVMIEERLAQIPEYVRRFKEVFGVERPIFDGVLKAIASFIRAEAVSKRVPFDDYLNGNAMALSESEKRGLRLFEGKAGCIRCHNGALASDQGFHNTGVPQEAIYDENPLVAVTIRFIHASRGVPENVYRSADSDPGLYLETKSETDIRKFRTPSLRELKYTEPYMHNGVFKSLKEVVDFYDKGGGDSAGKSTLLKPLALSESEKEDLIAFLKTLSSREVISIERPPIEEMVYAPSALKP